MQPTKNQQLYSNCSGKREHFRALRRREIATDASLLPSGKALLVGINYTGSSAALRGCHNDVKNLAAFLMERYAFKKEDMVLLMDLPQGTAMEQPTRANIVRVWSYYYFTSSLTSPCRSAGPCHAVARSRCSAERLALLPL